MTMSLEERREILRLNYIKDKDIFIFRWRILQVLCEAPETWGALTDVELITRARLLGYKNNELEQDFLVGNTCHNVYKALIDEVMTDLVNRRIVVREEDTINYGEIKMQKYRRGPALDEEGCRRITSIGLGDLDTYNRFFPN
jgi:hypothetical protein